MTDTKNLKARAEAVFGVQPAAPIASGIELEAEAAQAKIARLKALREAQAGIDAAGPKGRTGRTKRPR